MVTEEMILFARVREARHFHLKDLTDIAGQLNLINTVLGYEGGNEDCFDDIKAGLSILHSSIYEMMSELSEDKLEEN